MLIVPTTQPEAIEQYSIRVVDAWKLGREKPDDGALLLVAMQDRALRIEVGRGLEGALTDLVANRIIDETITPRFREGDFAGGIAAGVERMIAVVDGEPLPEPEQHWDGPQGLGGMLPILFFVVFFASTILRAIFGRALGSVATGGVAGGIAWIVTQVLGLSVGVGLVGLVLSLVLGFGNGGRWSSRARARRLDDRRAGAAADRAEAADSAAGAAASGAAAPRGAGRPCRSVAHSGTCSRRAGARAAGSRPRCARGSSRASPRSSAGTRARSASRSRRPSTCPTSGTARRRASGRCVVFGHLGVWDTEGNNGVLIYVLMADRDVEIVADRAIAARVTQADWDAVCREMEGHFSAGRFARRRGGRDRRCRRAARAAFSGTGRGSQRAAGRARLPLGAASGERVVDLLDVVVLLELVDELERLVRLGLG